MTSNKAVSSGRFRAIVLLFAALLLVVALHRANPPVVGLWQQTALNSSHVFVFALVALALFLATLQLARLSLLLRFSLALLAAIVVGTASEVAQISTMRDASFEDLVSNWLGATGALLLAAAFRRELSGRTRLSTAVAGVLVLLVALLPLLKVTAAYAERNSEKASLLSFDAVFANTFITQQNASLSILETASGGGKIGRVRLNDGPWPGLIIHDVWPDWRPYSTLVVDIAFLENAPLTVHFRVHDRAHRVGEQPYNDRFNLRNEITPGEHTIRIPLEAVRNAPHGREMDMSQIEGIVVFCTKKDAGRSFDLIGIRLE